MIKSTTYSLQRKEKSQHLSKYEDLLSGFSSLCSDASRSDVNSHELKISKSKFITLESLYNECNIKNMAGEIKLTRPNPDELAHELEFDMTNWISNGIWNYLCVSDLKGILEVYHNLRNLCSNNFLKLIHQIIIYHRSLWFALHSILW